MQRAAMVMVSALMACGGDDGGGSGDGGVGGDSGGDSACTFAITVTGSFAATFTESDPVSCAAATDLGGDPIFVFRPSHATIMRFDVEPAAAAGTTGPGIPGDVTLVTTNGSTWVASDCTFDVTRWDGAGTAQRLEAMGTCPNPAMPEAGSSTLMFTGLRIDM